MTAPFDRSPDRFDGWLIAGLTAVVFCVAHLPGWLSPYSVNDDVRQQLY